MVSPRDFPLGPIQKSIPLALAWVSSRNTYSIMPETELLHESFICTHSKKLHSWRQGLYFIHRSFQCSIWSPPLSKCLEIVVDGWINGWMDPLTSFKRLLCPFPSALHSSVSQSHSLICGSCPDSHSMPKLALWIPFPSDGPVCQTMHCLRRRGFRTNSLGFAD